MQRISSGGVFEERIGYCRAVVGGGFVHVAGTVCAPEVAEQGVVDQCQSALNIIETALAQAGVSFAQAVRVTYYLPNAADFQACWPLLAKTFGANPPAATMIECNLIDSKYRIEIELTALTKSPEPLPGKGLDGGP